MVLGKDDFVCGMELSGVEGVADAYLDHLAVVEDVLRAYGDHSVLLGLHLESFLLCEGVDSLVQLFASHILKLLLSGFTTVHEVEMLHFRDVLSAIAHFGNIDGFSLGVFLLLLGLTLQDQLRNLKLVFDGLLCLESFAEGGVLVLWVLFCGRFLSLREGSIFIFSAYEVSRGG